MGRPRAVLAAAAIALAACAERGAPAERPAPLLVLAVDGLEPSVVAELLAAGRLPTLARFAAEGVLGELETLVPTFSPVIWTTIATGQLPARHGVTHFLEPASGLPFTSNFRRVPALWNLASDAGLSVDVVGWWVSWPAEPVNGRVVASYAAQAQAHVIWKPAVYESLPDQTWPPELAAEVRPLLAVAEDPESTLAALFSDFPRPDVVDDLTQRLVQDLAWTDAGDRSFAAVGAHLLERDPGDLVLVYLALPDVAGHRFWRYHEPGAYPYPVPAAERERFGEYVRLAYELTDRRLGELLARAPAGANVLLVSDHGMHADPATLADPTAINSGHHEDGAPGVFGALGPAIAPAGAVGEPLGHVLDVAPLCLRLQGLAVPEHWPSARQGNRLAACLAPAWAAAHPERTRPSPDAAWAAANPRSAPLDPGGDVDLRFIEAFSALGYFDRPAPPPDPEGAVGDGPGQGAPQDGAGSGTR